MTPAPPVPVFVSVDDAAIQGKDLVRDVASNPDQNPSQVPHGSRPHGHHRSLALCANDMTANDMTAKTSHPRPQYEIQFFLNSQTVTFLETQETGHKTKETKRSKKCWKEESGSLTVLVGGSYMNLPG